MSHFLIGQQSFTTSSNNSEQVLVQKKYLKIGHLAYMTTEFFVDKHEINTFLQLKKLFIQFIQEQNVRLMQQLREKDDANFKLVSERIKLENIQKILKEEKEIYVQQVIF